MGISSLFRMFLIVHYEAMFFLALLAVLAVQYVLCFCLAPAVNRVLMQVTSMHFKARAGEKLADVKLQAALRKLQGNFVKGRADRVAELDNFQDIRTAAAAIRDRALANLDVYLEEFERNATARGAVVHWAETAEEANRIVCELAARYGVRKAAKSKSMVSEECALNDALEAAGIEVIETDLGEYILQLAHEPPSHIVAPVVHKSKDEVSDLFEEKHGLARKTGIPELCREAREMLRPHFLSADMGISGANFVIAETGSTLIVTNEGNGRMVTTLPRVHVTITGIEKVVPTLEDVTTLLRLLPRHGTGQSITNYISVTTGARGSGRSRRPRAFPYHPGRRRPHQADRQRHAGDAALHPLRRVHEPLPGVPERRRPCLRLGLSGADGLDPDAHLCRPRERARSAERIDTVQPVRSGLSGQDPAARPDAQAARKAVRTRVEAVAGKTGSRAVGAGWRGIRYLMRCLPRSARGRSLCMGGAGKLIHRLPLGGGWTDGRDLPAPQGKTFRELYGRQIRKG